MFEIIDSNTAIIYTDNPRDILKAASSLIDDSIKGFSIEDTNILGENIIVLSFSENNDSNPIDIVVVKTAADPGNEELESDDLEETPQEQTETPIEEDQPEIENQEQQNLNTEMAELKDQYYRIVADLDMVLQSIDNLRVAYIDTYTGHDVGDSEEGIPKTIPNIPSGRRHPSKGYIGIDHMPGNITPDGIQAPWVIIERTPGKDKPKILRGFTTEAEAKDYYNKMLTPGTQESARTRDLKQRNFFLRRIREQEKKLQDPVKAKKVYENNITALNRFEKVIQSIKKSVKRKDILFMARRNPEYKAAVKQLFNFAGTISIKLEDLMTQHVPSISEVSAIINGIIADSEDIILLDLSGVVPVQETGEDQSKPLRGKIIAPGGHEQMLEYLKKVKPVEKHKTI